MNESMYSEKSALELLNISRGELARLRREGLPYIRLSRKSRAYLWSDLLRFLVSRRIVRSQDASTPAPQYS